VVNKINGLWIPACAGMTDFLRFFTFFNTLLGRASRWRGDFVGVQGVQFARQDGAAIAELS
jgi:hypothetical protein